jgi:hypothetical protein
MTEKKFPYKGWVLTPSFTPVEKTFVGHGIYSYYSYHVTENKRYRVDMIFEDKSSAIAWGHKELEKQKAALDKKLANLEKRRKSLDKAQD